MIEELLRQVCLRICSLCYDQESARVFIDSMHQSDCRVVGVESLIITKMPGNCINQSAFVVAATGMHHKTCRLIDDKQDFVFIDNIEWQIFRNDFPIALRMVEDKRDDVASLYLIVALDGLVVCSDASCFSSFLDAVATRSRHVIHEELIDANRALTFIYLDTPMLVLFRKFFLKFKLIVKQYVFLQFGHPF